MPSPTNPDPENAYPHTPPYPSSAPPALDAPQDYGFLPCCTCGTTCTTDDTNCTGCGHRLCGHCVGSNLKVQTTMPAYSAESQLGSLSYPFSRTTALGLLQDRGFFECCMCGKTGTTDEDNCTRCGHGRCRLCIGSNMKVQTTTPAYSAETRLGTLSSPFPSVAALDPLQDHDGVSRCCQCGQWGMNAEPYTCKGCGHKWCHYCFRGT